MENLVARDLWTGQNNWTTIIDSRGLRPPKEEEQKDIGNVRDTLINQEASVIQIKMENNNGFNECPFHFEIRIGRPVYLFGNIPLIFEISRTIQSSLQNEKIDLDYFAQIAMGQINTLQNRA
mmetsp:Transcript_3165/g.4827  ORF Transcript_3165/g.4827 Transcript_3165/m.4827 type:complete len:122 (-) Transcript_3165:7973-8338(-)